MSGKRIAFHIVDVFAIEPLSGNPLAVVEDADDGHPAPSRNEQDERVDEPRGETDHPARPRP